MFRGGVCADLDTVDLPTCSPATAKAPPPAWSPPAGAPPQVQTDWALLGSALAQMGVPVPSVTASTSVALWCVQAHVAINSDGLDIQGGTDDAFRALGPVRRVRDAFLAVRLGVAPEDLFQVGQVMGAVHGSAFAARPNAATTNLRIAVQARFSGFTLRAAVGWLLVEPSMHPDAEFCVRDHVNEYARAGLGEQGWLYAAAGLSPGEAVAVRAAGSVRATDLRVMAGLRGVPLPTG